MRGARASEAEKALIRIEGAGRDANERAAEARIQEAETALKRAEARLVMVEGQLSQGTSGKVAAAARIPSEPSYITGMLRTKPNPRFHVSQFAHDRALHFLARPQQYGLTSETLHQLTQVAEGYTGSCDEPAARSGIDWMRQHYRLMGQTPVF